MNWLIAALLLPSSALANEELRMKYGPLIEQCYEENQLVVTKRQCIGTLASQCMDKEEGGGTTFGISLCNSAEAQFWDEKLNLEYKTTMKFMKELDHSDMEFMPEFAVRETALRDAQRAWIGFRDAQCGLEYANWGSGSMRHIAGTACLSDMTARRVLELITLRATY